LERCYTQVAPDSFWPKPRQRRPPPRRTALIIDTHLEVWTFDPKFPFHHPERPDLKRVDVEAPIENEVAEMRDFGLKYTVLVNPRFFGWDNSYIADSLRRYPKLFVAHGLLRLNAVFNYYILPQQMPMLEDMAERFPGVKIVVDHLGKPDLRAADPWLEFRKMFRLKRFPQVWISASEPYELSLTKQFPYRDTYPFVKATYEEFG
jgi:predicted TIM-barrel fold metal-dependent hydrolase